MTDSSWSRTYKMFYLFKCLAWRCNSSSMSSQFLVCLSTSSYSFQFPSHIFYQLPPVSSSNGCFSEWLKRCQEKHSSILCPQCRAVVQFVGRNHLLHTIEEVWDFALPVLSIAVYLLLAHKFNQRIFSPSCLTFLNLLHLLIVIFTIFICVVFFVFLLEW